MSKFAQFLRNCHDLEWWLDTAIPWMKNRTPPRLIDSYGSLYSWLSRVEQRLITEEDWDTLLLLDACRYDIFRKTNKLPGQTDVRYSIAPQTPAFLELTFGDDTFHDIVYVTANPHVHQRLDEQQFHAVYNVWDTHWDEDLKSVPPESVVEVARTALDAHPNKRLIAHFMQPHLPFIGDWARKEIGIYDGYERMRESAIDETSSQWMTDPYALASDDKIEIDMLRRAYEENLRVALDAISNLINDLVGKTVVTADHGELLGDIAWPYPWREYGHPDLRSRKALEVPWHVLPYETRRSVTAEPPEGSTTADELDIIEEKLSDLGYR